MQSSGSSVTSSLRLLVKVKSTTTKLLRFWVPKPLLSYSTSNPVTSTANLPTLVLSLASLASPASNWMDGSWMYRPRLSTSAPVRRFVPRLLRAA